MNENIYNKYKTVGKSNFLQTLKWIQQIEAWQEKVIDRKGEDKKNVLHNS